MVSMDNDFPPFFFFFSSAILSRMKERIIGMEACIWRKGKYHNGSSIWVAFVRRLMGLEMFMSFHRCRVERSGLGHGRLENWQFALAAWLVMEWNGMN